SLDVGVVQLNGAVLGAESQILIGSQLVRGGAILESIASILQGSGVNDPVGVDLGDLDIVPGGVVGNNIRRELNVDSDFVANNTDGAGGRLLGGNAVDRVPDVHLALVGERNIADVAEGDIGVILVDDAVLNLLEGVVDVQGGLDS